MLICRDCGGRNEDDERFCGTCGAYLEWEGERVATAAQPAPPVEAAAEPPAEPVSLGLVDRVRTAVGLGTDEAENAVGRAAQPGTPGRAEPLPDIDLRDRPTAPTAQPAPPAGPDPLPSSGPPAAVRPGARAPAPRARTAPPDDEPAARPGDLVCGRCGAGNVPTRAFCRRCGNDLVDAPVVPPSSWWRRLLERRSRRVLAAGARPRRRRRLPTGRLVLLLLLGLLALGIWQGRPLLERAVDAVVDRVAGSSRLVPATISASSAAPGRPAALAVDGATNRSWAPAQRGEAVGEFVEATFTEPFRLVGVRVFSGASRQEPEFLAEGRPQTVQVTTTTQDGGTRSTDITLRNVAGEQTFGVPVDGVVQVRLTVRSAYPVPPGQRLALAEVEFLARD